MSDLLTRFVDATESIAKSLSTLASKASAPAAAASPPKPVENRPASDKPKDNKAVAAASGGAKETAKDKAPAASAPAGTTKAPGGKRTLDNVRDIIRKVATTEGLGKPEAINILEENGGVKSVAELKPENFDAVYEACEVAVTNAGKPVAADDVADLM